MFKHQANAPKRVERGRRGRRSRFEIARVLSACARRQNKGGSQRRSAEEQEVPGTTLQHGSGRKERTDADPELVELFESAVA